MDNSREEHVCYSVVFEEQEEWEGPEEYDPELDGELEWYEAEWRKTPDHEDEELILEDCISYAKRFAECEGVRNVRVVETVMVEREVFRP